MDRIDKIKEMQKAEVRRMDREQLLFHSSFLLAAFILSSLSCLSCPSC
jgi:hypothetical protein